MLNGRFVRTFFKAGVALILALGLASSSAGG